MRNLLTNTKAFKFGAVYLMVAVFFAGTPITVSAAVVTDIKANGSDGTVTILDGDSYSYEWVTTNATACTLTSPTGPSGITTAGNGGPIDPGHPWYPAVGSPVTLTLDCTDGVETSSDSVTIEIGALPPPPPPAVVTADIKAEGSDGPVNVVVANEFSYSWTSSNATACTLTSPSGDSGISLAGNGGPIGMSHPWYLPGGGAVTLTLSCTDGVSTATDTVVINLLTFTPPPPPPPAVVTADITANGSNGPVTIASGDSFVYAWTSSNATACTLTAPNGPSGISLAGNGGPIDASHPWYPAIGSPTTLTLDCTDGTNTATDNVVINLTAVPPSGVTADIKANGSDGPVTINNGTDYAYSWTSTGATACTLTAPNGVSGISLAGNGGPISPSHPWYPAVSAPVTLTLDCTDGVNTASDLVVINVSLAPVVVTADIKINDSDGPVVIPNGTSWNYSWTSGNATTCTLTSPTGPSGITTAGNGGPIDPGHPWYPAVGSSTTLTIDCTNGGSTATDSVVISVTTLPPPPPPPGGCLVSLSITSEGSASVRLNSAFSYTVTSSVTGSVATTTYTMSGALPAGLSFNASTGTISGTPTEKGTFTVTFSATNDCANASKTLTISVTTGGGGGGGGGGGHHSDPIPSLEGFCPYLTNHLRYGAVNDVMQVIKLQAFLKTFEHFDYVSINGVFDEATLQAVKAFQARYASEILTPWGISEPTGYVYTLTLAKINQILCGSPMPTVHVAAPVVHISKEGGSKEGMGGGLANAVPVVGANVSNGQKVEKEGFWSHLATALFSFPDNAVGFLQTTYELLLILIVLYILGSIFESVLYKDVPENVSKRYKARWITIVLGFVIAICGAYFAAVWALLFPLLVGLIAIAIYLALTARKSKKLLPLVIVEEKVEVKKEETN